MSPSVPLAPAPGPSLRLRRRVLAGWRPPTLDASQRRVVAHRGGPLRVVGAPGTGKTTAVVEAVVDRVNGQDGLDAGSVLVLAPTRLAAARLREQVTARLGRTVSEPLARTPASFAFGVLRRAAALRGEPAPRLISGPEQDLVLRELLAGHVAGEGSAPVWPDDLLPALRTRGFRGELRDLLMRAVERGLDDAELAELGRRHARPEWVAAARLLNEYLGVTGLATPGAYDPASIAGTAAAELEADPDLLAAVRSAARFVAVDDAHELTSASADLLRLVVGPGGPLLLAGDPDVVTQGFRGADPELLVSAASGLAAPGHDVPTVVLTSSYRQGPALRAVTRRVVDSVGVVGGATHREVACDERLAGTSQVHVLRSAVHEAAFVAQLLRRRHLEDDVAWSDMAVVVRGGARAQTLRRVLVSAGVPVEVPPTEAPVRDQPAVVPLLDAFEVALRLHDGTSRADATCPQVEPADPGTGVDPALEAALDPERAVDLLCSPLGGADPVALRRLRRALRAEEIAGGGGRASDELLVVALLDPALLAGVDDDVAAPARRVARVLAAGRAAVAQAGASAESVLWALWSASGLSPVWRSAALSGTTAASRADRDLDSVVALFDAAARFADRLPLAPPSAFVEHLRGQEVPGDTLAERAAGRDAVALVTPAGAAGLGWRVVVVAGVQEGVWPDLRSRGSLLGSQQLVDLLTGRSASSRAAARVLRDDETRLFHLAVSRASELLVVTAVRDEDEQPSDLLDMVDPPPTGPVPEAAAAGATSGFDEQGRRVAGLAPRPLALPALVARLRQAVTHPDAATDERRGAEADAAALQLARLATAGVAGADPADWYALAPLSDEADLRLESPVRISPSKVEEFERCSLRWLLSAAGGQKPRSLAQGLGNLVHEIAADMPDADTPALTAELHRRWDRLGLGAGWAADTERARLQSMIGKLGSYLAAERAHWSLVDVERAFETEVDTEQGPVLLTGRVDRLETDAQGRLRVVDLKTGKTAPTGSDVPEHAQLGTYQVAVEQGAFSDGEPAVSGGAALVHLGTPTTKHKTQHQPALTEVERPDWALQLLARVGAGMSAADFPATVNEVCARCSLRPCCPAADGRQVTA